MLTGYWWGKAEKGAIRAAAKQVGYFFYLAGLETSRGCLDCVFGGSGWTGLGWCIFWGESSGSWGEVSEKQYIFLRIFWYFSHLSWSTQYFQQRTLPSITPHLFPASSYQSQQFSGATSHYLHRTLSSNPAPASPDDWTHSLTVFTSPSCCNCFGNAK